MNLMTIAINRSIVHQEKITLKNKSETQAFILKLAKSFQPRQIVLLQGVMGVGKTQLVSWLAREGAGAETDEAASPTYAFHHRYKRNDGKTIEHFDLDRIQSESDLESIGFWDIFSEESGWVMIEWPERINLKHLPRAWPVTHIKIETSGEERSIQVTIYG